MRPNPLYRDREAMKLVLQRIADHYGMGETLPSAVDIVPLEELEERVRTSRMNHLENVLAMSKPEKRAIYERRSRRARVDIANADEWRNLLAEMQADRFSCWSCCYTRLVPMEYYGSCWCSGKNWGGWLPICIDCFNTFGKPENATDTSGGCKDRA